jgi:hypothetical protein
MAVMFQACAKIASAIPSFCERARVQQSIPDVQGELTQEVLHDAHSDSRTGGAFLNPGDCVDLRPSRRRPELPPSAYGALQSESSSRENLGSTSILARPMRQIF